MYLHEWESMTQAMPECLRICMIWEFSPSYLSAKQKVKRVEACTWKKFSWDNHHHHLKIVPPSCQQEWWHLDHLENMQNMWESTESLRGEQQWENKCLADLPWGAHQSQWAIDQQVWEMDRSEDMKTMPSFGGHIKFGVPKKVLSMQSDIWV